MAKALIVDDDTDWLTFAEEILGSQNVQTTTCENGRAAFEFARALQPEMIVLDIMMPGMDGFQLLWHLTNTEETAGIPIVVLSARESAFDVAWGKRLGAYAFLSKQTPFEDLAQSLANIASSAIEQRENVRPPRSLN